jgi:hypothetical protein
MSNQDNGINRNEELFIAYFDGDLPPAEMDEFEQRLDSDSQFAKQFNRYRKTIELVRSLPSVTAPPSLLPAIERRLQRRQQMRGPAYQLRFPYELLVFVALLVGILYMYFGMVPTGPGAIAYTVKVQISQPLPETVQETFGFTRTEDREGGITHYKTRTNRASALKIVEAIRPLSSRDLKLPQGVDLIEFRLRTQNR